MGRKESNRTILNSFLYIFFGYLVDGFFRQSLKVPLSPKDYSPFISIKSKLGVLSQFLLNQEKETDR